MEKNEAEQEVTGVGYSTKEFAATEENKHEGEVENLKEYYVGSSTSFDEVEERRRAEERVMKISELTDIYLQMVMNVMELSVNKLQDMSRLSQEFIARLGNLIEAEQREAVSENKEDLVELKENEESPITELEESEVGPLRAIVRIIKPGWGNKTHNHYYPKDVLQRDAYKFIGAKMFETDHRPHEKSTRTWVSTIEDIVGFDDGAPLAKVAVHDPGFAERLRNLGKLGSLEKMECSIYANGLAKGGFKLNGREGKQVEGIADVSSVDWVTRAGAGGAAVSLIENEEELNMSEEIIVKPVEEGVAEDAVTEEKVEEIEIREADKEEVTELLEVEKVKKILSESGLPKYAQTKLSYSGRFMTEDDVKEAAQAELEYLKAITGSGKPFGMSKQPQGIVEDTNKIAEADKAKDDLVKDFLQIKKN